MFEGKGGRDVQSEAEKFQGDPENRRCATVILQAIAEVEERGEEGEGHGEEGSVRAGGYFKDSSLSNPPPSPPFA